MELRSLGKTNLQVTPIGLGLAALGRPGYVNLGHAEDLGKNYDETAMEGHTHSILDEAWDQGIRYFDAARSYGKAEKFLGNWLRSRAITPDAVTIGSKWGYTYTANWQVKAEKHEVKEHSLKVLQKQWKETKENLGDYINIYQIHSATLESGVLDNTEVLNELARLKSEGLKIGLTLSGTDQSIVLEKALTKILDGRLLFDTVQATWNILESSVGEALAHAKREGMGIIIKESLANGRLTEKNVDPDIRDKFNNLKEIARESKTSIDAVAIAIVLNQPWVDVVLSGAAKKEHLRSNVQAMKISINPDSEAQIIEGFKESPKSYWHIRKNLEWN